MSRTPPGARRRVSVAHARAAATRTLQRTITLLETSPAPPDAPLLEACRAYAGIRHRIDTLSGARTDLDETAREQAQANLNATASVALAQVAARRARTLDGHRARAAAILLWDEGELIALVARYGILQDRLVLALLSDLAGL